MFKVLVVVLLVLIAASLASGLVFIIRDRGQGARAAKALTVRVALSFGLFALVLLAYAIGWIEPPR